MNEIFYNKDQSTFYNIQLDVGEIYKKFPISRKTNPKPNRVNFNRTIFHKLYRNPVLPLSLRRKLWLFFRNSNLDLSWFKEFNNYWTNKIKGRPLQSVYDLYFLKNLYRMKFQGIQIPDTNDPFIHLEAWQRPELLYQLLHLVCVNGVNFQYRILRLLNKFKKNFGTILEFGCATAPITTALFEFFHLPKNIKIFISDIQTFAFHYGSFKFRGCSNVIPILLTPENDFFLDLGEKIDVIFCTGVFEHLNKPFETIKRFYEILNNKGVLFMDYVISSGDSLDTHHSFRERNQVLDFVSDNFKTLYGKISKERSMNLSVFKKS